MNAAEIARAVEAATTLLKVQAASSNPKIREGGTVGLLCRAVLDAEAQDHSGCQYSTGICGSITAGRGKLDENGYFEFPCASCARIANLEEHLCALQCVHEAYRARVRKVVDAIRFFRRDADFDMAAWVEKLTEKGND